MEFQKIGNRHDLTKVAQQLNITLSKAAEKYFHEIQSLNCEISRIEGLTLMNEEGERKKAFHSTKAILASCAEQLQQTRRDGGFGGLGAPIQTIKAWRNHQQAQAMHAQTEKDFDEPETLASRRAQIAAHNEHVDGQQRELPSLREKLVAHKTVHVAILRFQEAAGDAVNAAFGEGWIAPDFTERFQTMTTLVLAGRLTDATRQLAELSFQKTPPSTTYARWLQEAIAIRDAAYHQYAGVAASGAYSEIAVHSAQLASGTLGKGPTSQLENCTHPADKWQLLSGLATDPRNFQVDALWAIYWAMFQCGQQMAGLLSEADAHEDIFTGKFSAQLDHWLSHWATSRIREFGYPETQSYLGTLEIAGTAEETRLGADIGLIIELNVGGLVCRKVALFQAKKAKQGTADIGSKTGQLTKLSHHPQTGFYLFYHQSQYPLNAPAPTVCSADTLRQRIVDAERSPEARSLYLDVRKFGWDWGSFVTFGLCCAESNVGESFDTIDDALHILGGGNVALLPKYLHVVAINNKPAVLELQQRLQKHYHETEKVRQKSNDRNRGHSRTQDGYEHGLG